MAGSARPRPRPLRLTKIDPRTIGRILLRTMERADQDPILLALRLAGEVVEGRLMDDASLRGRVRGLCLQLVKILDGMESRHV